MRKREVSLWPGALLGVVLLVALQGVAPNEVPPVAIGSEDNMPPELDGSFIECWLFPWLSWCHTPEPPGPMQPEPVPCDHPCGSDDTCCE